MADQSVKITNLPDSGSAARVAFDIWVALKAGNTRAAGSSFKEHVEERLNLYVACRNAVENGIVDVSKIK